MYINCEEAKVAREPCQGVRTLTKLDMEGEGFASKISLDELSDG